LPHVAGLDLLAGAAVFLVNITCLGAAVFLAVLLLDVAADKHVSHGGVVKAHAARLRPDVVQTLEPSRPSAQVQQVVKHVELSVVEATYEDIVEAGIVAQYAVIDLFEGAIVHWCDGLRCNRQGAMQGRCGQHQSTGNSTEFEPAPLAAIGAGMGRERCIHDVSPFPSRLVLAESSVAISGAGDPYRHRIRCGSWRH